MFADQSLTPKEALRLAVLGTLALKPEAYGALAVSVRHFVDRVVGPSPEIMGHSIELLRYEGLVEAEGRGEDAVLRLTDAGRTALHGLLMANLRAADTALNKLVTALKVRFLHLLSPGDQCLQAELLLDVCEQEIARLEDLRRHHEGDEGHLIPWLDHDLGLLKTRRAWLEGFRQRICGTC